MAPQEGEQEEGEGCHRAGVVPAVLRAAVAGWEGQGPKATTTGRLRQVTGTTVAEILTALHQCRSSEDEAAGEEEEDGEDGEDTLCSSRGAAAVACRPRSTLPLPRTVGGRPLGSIRALSTME